MPIIINPKDLSKQTLEASEATQGSFDKMFARIYNTFGRTGAATAQTGDATAQTATATGGTITKTGEATGGTITKTGEATGGTITKTGGTITKTGEATGGTITKTGEATGENSATATGFTAGSVSESANQTATKQSQGTYNKLPGGDIDLSTSPTVTADATKQGCKTPDLQAILEAAKKGAKHAAELYDKGKQQGCCPTTIRQPINYEPIEQARAGNRR